MSRGVGTAQQTILALLPDEKMTTVKDLARRLDRSDRQIIRAVRSLEQRGLVEITYSYGGNGRCLYVWKPGAQERYTARPVKRAVRIKRPQPAVDRR